MNPNPKCSTGMVVLGAVGLALAQGCATTRVISDPVGQPPTESARPVAESAVRQLNVHVATAGKDNLSRDAALSVQDLLESRLVDEGYTVDAGYVDIHVDLDAAVEVFDRSGNYIVYDGVLAAEVNRTGDEKLLAGRKFTGRGDRALGEAKAMDNLVGTFAGTAGDWLISSLSPTRTGVGVEDITVQRVWYSPGRPDYATVFVEEVNRLDGIVSCQLVSHDRSTRTMVFRVGFFRDRFPDGLLNRLALIPALHLKPSR